MLVVRHGYARVRHARVEVTMKSGVGGVNLLLHVYSNELEPSVGESRVHLAFGSEEALTNERLHDEVRTSIATLDLIRDLVEEFLECLGLLDDLGLVFAVSLTNVTDGPRFMVDTVRHLASTSDDHGNVGTIDNGHCYLHI